MTGSESKLCDNPECDMRKPHHHGVPLAGQSKLQECGDCGGDLNHLDRAGSVPCKCEGEDHAFAQSLQDCFTEEIARERPDHPDWHQVWRTGTGQIITRVHPANKCVGEHCSVHNPSDHHMRDWPTHLRGSNPFDLGIFTERICEHGVGHPDPDDPFAPAEHGCDGCCNPVTALQVELDDLQQSFNDAWDAQNHFANEDDQWQKACIHAKAQRDRAICKVIDLGFPAYHPDKEGPYNHE